MSPNPLWDLIQTYMDLPMHRYRPVAADLARETGVSDQVISKWKSKPMLPTAEQLAKFSAGTGIDYSLLLQAALRGKGYLPLSENVTMSVQGPGREMLDWVRKTEGHEGLYSTQRALGLESAKIIPGDASELERLDRIEGQGAVRAQQRRRGTKKAAARKKAADSDTA